MQYNLSSTTDVIMQVYNQLGQMVFSENQKANTTGMNIKELYLSDLAKGMYLLRIVSDHELNEQKLIIE